MRGKDSNVRHALNDLGFVGILPSADFGDRFVRHPEVKMLLFFLPPSLCDLDVGLETDSFLEQIAWNRTIQVDSSFHGHSRFPVPVLASNARGEPPRHGRHPPTTKLPLARSAPLLCSAGYWLQMTAVAPI